MFARWQRALSAGQRSRNNPATARVELELPSVVIDQACADFAGDARAVQSGSRTGRRGGLIAQYVEECFTSRCKRVKPPLLSLLFCLQVAGDVPRPGTVILACSDSRVPPEIVLDQGLGDCHVVRCYLYPGTSIAIRYKMHKVHWVWLEIQFDPVFSKSSQKHLEPDAS